jgi:peptidoglycan/LPS O-acetylase OafA/YrhL
MAEETNSDSNYLTGMPTETGDPLPTRSGSEQSNTDAILPSERKFRPDVEGLRALAILLVVLYHADVPGVRGGYVGVDVFFVISGFLITGLLFKEADNSGRVSLTRFYARRFRRILPAATVVIILTVLASYHWLGFLQGNSVAIDAKWASVFLANIHFAVIGTQYFGSETPPSPLQHMWSLSVEEQFYAVWPLLLLTVTMIARRISLRLRLGAVLVVIIGASLAWSIIETSQNGVWAYFSPLTRAWELAAGGLIAVAAPLAARIPKPVALVVGFGGLIGILVSGTVFSARTPYPGSAVALPVLGTVMVIAAGSAVAGMGVERILRPRPVQWLGARSYSLYLWHWPILVIAAERVGKVLPVWQNMLCLLAALAASALTYWLIENPIRRARVLVARPVVSVVMGLCLIGATLAVAQHELQSHSGPNGTGQPAARVGVRQALPGGGITQHSGGGTSRCPQIHACR